MTWLEYLEYHGVDRFRIGPKEAYEDARRIERERAKELVEALHRISLTAQNSMSSKNECGNIARDALTKYERPL